MGQIHLWPIHLSTWSQSTGAGWTGWLFKDGKVTVLPISYTEHDIVAIKKSSLCRARQEGLWQKYTLFPQPFLVQLPHTLLGIRSSWNSYTWLAHLFLGEAGRLGLDWVCRSQLEQFPLVAVAAMPALWHPYLLCHPPPSPKCSEALWLRVTALNPSFLS